jgi:hypothetical protein
MTDQTLPQSAHDVLLFVRSEYRREHAVTPCITTGSVIASWHQLDAMIAERDRLTGLKLKRCRSGVPNDSCRR